MADTSSKSFHKIMDAYSLELLPRSADLSTLAKQWGVTSIEEGSIASEAMLLPSSSGYKVILRNSVTPGQLVRQRFSFAHELGHLLLREAGCTVSSKFHPNHRSHSHHNEEERLCDQIAAEILMPRIAFLADATELGWSLGSLRPLARRYETSIPATARRMVGLMGETCTMGIWKPSAHHDEHHLLNQSFDVNNRYGVPNSTGLPRRRLWLVGRSANGSQVEEGFAPLVDKKHPRTVPADVPAEAWAWGWKEHRRVMVFYYPERHLTGDMAILSKVTGMG